MAYIPHTPAEVSEMLAVIGVESVDDLFADIPEAIRLKAPPAGIPAPLSEHDTLRLMARRAARNKPAASAHLSFLGAGSYEHFIPSAVNAIAQRGEILTAYTPYQAEASQGTLQIVFEFQSMVCALTGLDVANASLYDGGSALAEGVLMGLRITGRDQVVLPETLHPNYRAVVESYVHDLGAKVLTWKAPGGTLDPAGYPAEADAPAVVVIQQPNFYGFLEDAAALAAVAKSKGAVVVASANPMSLSAIEPPGAWGADIAVGECQPIGLPMNFGGPYAGYMAARAEHIRRMPGRIVGRTADHEGREGFVLTLQTREQHIRRERATSNICTNQGLCATMVTLWLSLIGRSGFEKLGLLNLERAGRLFNRLVSMPGVEPFAQAPFFNEFTLRLPVAAETFARRMHDQCILAGLPVTRLIPEADPNLLIVCATETKTFEDLEIYVERAEAALKG